jgi:hypothetical protein
MRADTNQKLVRIVTMNAAPRFWEISRLRSVFIAVMVASLTSPALATQLLMPTRWLTPVTALHPTDPNTLYSLVAVGQIRGEFGSGLDRFRDRWLRSHSKAIMRSVCDYPLIERIPGSKLVFAWITSGDDNLNVDLVRQGFVVAEYMFISKGGNLLISKEDYALFIRKVKSAEAAAQREKLGVWGHHRPSTADD